MTAPEFSRPERLDVIGAGDRTVTVEADPGERLALARRFGLVSVGSLAGSFAVRREAAGIRVRGRVLASLTQACSVTGVPLAVQIDEPVDLMFTDPPAGAADEVELGADSIDIVFHDGAAIDLGETAAETMALALDPFPRGPGADAALKAAGVSGAAESGPFGGLAGLFRKD